MVWKIELWVDSPPGWVEKTDATIVSMPAELNGHEEAVFTIPNTSANRSFVDADVRIRISWDTTVIWRGMLYAPLFGNDLITCICYNECFEEMKQKDYTATHTSIAANTILAAICTAAGVVAGSCPSTLVSVRFRRTKCFDAAVFLAEAVNGDYWGDYDGSENPRFNISARGSAKGSITPIAWPERGKDRAKKRDKVIIVGVDADGNEIEGSAGTGTDIEVFREKKASDVATLNNIAAQKLAELNTESSGVTLPVLITAAYNLYPGDTITLNKPTLELVGDFRIWTITKYLTKADVEVERPEAIGTKYLDETKQYEEQGIYILSTEQIPDRYYDKEADDVDDIADVTKSPPSFSVTAEEIDTTTLFRCWLKITITRVTGAGGYIISYNETGSANFRHISVEQPVSGNPVVVTEDLKADTIYDIKACTLSKLGAASSWSSVQNKTTAANQAAPPVPTGLTASPVLNGVLIEWQHVGASDLMFYQVYRSITSNPGDAVSAGTTRGNVLLWKVEDPDAEYITHYFWVTAIDTSNNESAKQGTPVSATPERVKPIDLTIESRPWTADFKIWEDETTFGKLYWAAKDDVSNITIKFADGTSKTINANISGTTFSAGLRYFYWQDGQSALQNSVDYDDAVGEGKGLLAVVDVKTSDRSTILPYNSYMPTIGTGALAAKAILAQHIKAGQIQTDHLEVACITAPKLAEDAIMFTYSDVGLVLALPLDEGTGSYVYDWSTQANSGAISGATWTDGKFGKALLFNGTSDYVNVGDIAALAVTSITIIAWVKLASSGGTQAVVDRYKSTPNDGYMIRITNSRYLEVVLGNGTTEYVDQSTLQIAWDTWHFIALTYDSTTGKVYAYIDGVQEQLDDFTGALGDAGRVLQISSQWFGQLVKGTVDEVRVYDHALSADEILSLFRIGASKYDMITTTKVLSIAATKILLSGSVYLSDWRNASDLTKIEGSKIYTGTIDSDQIKANAVKTSELQFDRVTSDPSGEGKLWYRSDFDQLRFRGVGSLVGYIPRYPLTDDTAPPENLIPNQCFELDRDDDDVPDYWMFSGSGTIERITTDSYKGGACIRLYCTSAQNVGAWSEFCPVKPNLVYYASAAVKRVSGSYNAVVRIHWYTRTKAESSTPHSDAYDGSATTSWGVLGGTVTSPSDAAYARVEVYIWQPSPTAEMRYDDIVFSEQRAAIPTEGVVGGITSDYYTTVHINTTWTTAVEIVVPDVDHEVYYIISMCTCKETQTSQAHINVRLYDVTANIYYPSLSTYYWILLRANFWEVPFDCFFTIPRNVKGHTLRLQMRVDTSGLDSDFYVRLLAWGHSPHSHR